MVLESKHGKVKKRKWAAVNLSWDTYTKLINRRKPNESLNDLIRGLMGEEVPDPTRNQRRRPYFDQDWIVER